MSLNLARDLLARSHAAMLSNMYVSGLNGGSVAVLTEMDTDYTKEYTAANSPCRYIGGEPVLEDWGIRLYNTTFKPTENRGANGGRVFVLYGDSAIFQIEKGYEYRFLAKDTGADRYISLTPVLETGTGPVLVKLTLPAFGMHVVTIECSANGNNDNGLCGRLGAMYVQEGQKIWAQPQPSPRVTHIGASDIMNTLTRMWDAYPSVTWRLLGCQDIRLAAIYSTGALHTDIGANLWAQHAQDWEENNSDVIVFHICGLDAEYNSTEDCKNAVLARVESARLTNPDALIFVDGTFTDYESSGDDLYRAVNDAVRDVLIALEDRYIRYVEVLPDAKSDIYDADMLDTFLGVNGHHSTLGNITLGMQFATYYQEALVRIINNIPDSGNAIPPAEASISPTSRNVNLTVATPVDMVLGTVSNGTPSGTPTGIAPSGCTFSWEGQNLKLEGTPDTEDADISTVIGGTTDNGDITFNLTGSVFAEGSTDDPFIDDTVIVLNGSATDNEIAGGIALTTPGSVPSATGWLEFDPGEYFLFSRIGYTGVLSLELKIRMPSPLANGSMIGSIDGNDKTFEVGVTDGGQIFMYQWGEYIDFASAVLTAGQQVDFGYFFDSSTGIAYISIDGEPVYESALAQPLDMTNTYIGRRPDNFGANTFPGGLKVRMTDALRHTDEAYTPPVWPVPTE